MFKKIIIIIVILVVLGCGIYFGISKFGKGKLGSSIEGIKVPELTMPFDSGLEELELDSFNIGASLPSGLFSDIFIDTDLGY